MVRIHPLYIKLSENENAFGVTCQISPFDIIQLQKITFLSNSNFEKSFLKQT